MKYGLTALFVLLMGSTPTQDPNQPWAVRFEVVTRPTSDVPNPPVCHISVVIKAGTEAEAGAVGLAFVQKLVSIDVQERLKFYDCCKKEK